MLEMWSKEACSDFIKTEEAGFLETLRTELKRRKLQTWLSECPLAGDEMQSDFLTGTPEG